MTLIDLLENAAINLGSSFMIGYGFYLKVRHDVKKDKEAAMDAAAPRSTTSMPEVPKES